jgi:hypothetical protein
MDWVRDIIKEYIIKNQIPTTTEQIQKLAEYYTEQGYASVGLVCDALIADSKTMEILRRFR